MEPFKRFASQPICSSVPQETFRIMLFSLQAGFLNTADFKHLQVGDYTYYYSGILYVRGHKAGQDSVAAMARDHQASGAIPFKKILGAFSCAVVSPNGETAFFTDNSNLHCFYVGCDAIGDSLLELSSHEKAYVFNEESVCELFALGDVFFGKTLISGVATTAYDRVYIFSKGSIRDEHKDIGPFSAPTDIEDIDEFFRDMAFALADDRVTLSLTGGYDSRLVLACLMEHLPISVFISCTDEAEPDVYWAKKAARAAGKTLELLKVGKPTINEEYLRKLFDDADGNGVVVDDNHMRISAFMENRRESGYSCYLTGDGGPRHKDWYWVQDLPFYRKKNTDVARFYDQRIRVIETPFLVGARLERHNRILRQRMIATLQQYVMPLNTESYDSIGFHVFGDSGKVKYSVGSRVVASYAPLWELELVRYSYHLPRMKRFFYNSMRDMISRKSKALARTPTVYGTTASNEPLFLARDIIFQVADYSRKAVRLLGRRFLHKNLLVGHPTRWSAEFDVRGLDIARRAVDYCVREELISVGATPDGVAYRTLGRMIQLYLMAEKMKLWEMEEQRSSRPLT